ncbi:MAG TPA: alpha/beta fold hydrolase [Armatimonadota bacterium]
MKGILWAAGAVAVPAAVNAIVAARAGKMEQPLPGDIAYYDWVYGRVAFYRLGQGPPVVLVHNPNAGASAWEWRKVFPELANTHTVYALDLLGYGISEKPDIPYRGSLYADLLHDFLEDVVGHPAHIIGSALGASYAVNVAVRRPELVERLVLVNPTGTTSHLSTVTRGVTLGIMQAPVVGTSIYYSLVSRPGIERELREHIYYDPTFVTPEMVDFLHASAHQPGSQHAAVAFVTGLLDLPMRMAFADIDQPTLLIWGRDAEYTPVGDAADLLYRDPKAQLSIFDDCGMLPHDEKAGEFIRTVRPFLLGTTTGEIAA